MYYDNNQTELSLQFNIYSFFLWCVSVCVWGGGGILFVHLLTMTSTHEPSDSASSTLDSTCSCIAWPTQHELRNTMGSDLNLFFTKSLGSVIPSLFMASYSAIVTILKYHNTQISQYSIITILNYHNTQLSQYSNITILKYHNTQISQYSNITILNYHNTQLSQYSNITILKYHNTFHIAQYW